MEALYSLTVVTCLSTITLTLPTAERASLKAGRPTAGAAIAEPRERAARAKVVNCILGIAVLVYRDTAKCLMMVGLIKR
jgi:hypothetical protein